MSVSSPLVTIIKVANGVVDHNIGAKLRQGSRRDRTVISPPY